MRSRVRSLCHSGSHHCLGSQSTHTCVTTTVSPLFTVNVRSLKCVRVPPELDTRGVTDYSKTRYTKQEVVNKEPLTSFIWHRQELSNSDYVKMCSKRYGFTKITPRHISRKRILTPEFFMSDDLWHKERKQAEKDKRRAERSAGNSAGDEMDLHPDWELYRTSPTNPRQLWHTKSWTPVPGLRKSRGHTTGSMHAILPDYSTLWTQFAPALTARIGKSGGRHWNGRLRTRHRGGSKRAYHYRKIDYMRRILDEVGIVERIEHDPFRSGNLAFIRYPESGRIQYQTAVLDMKPGDQVFASRTDEPKYFKPGYSMPLKFVPMNSTICMIEPKPGDGARIARAAGSHARVLNKNSTREGYALVEMCSKELRLFHLDCMVTLGRVSNAVWKRISWGKAGKRRNLGTGWRPAVRGVAMNANAHPHGGGTKHKRTRPPNGGGLVTYKGKPMCGYKTIKKWRQMKPVEDQMVLKRRPRNFKRGQIF